MTLTAEDVRRCAVGHEADFRAILARCGPYVRQGILPSELFYAYAVFHASGATRIVESGRCSGYSTELLARFGAERFDSVEIERGTSQAQEAEARVAGLPVTLHYGDGRELVPELVTEDTMVMIDGPKQLDGLRLAVECLRRGVPAVLHHDTAPQKPTGILLTRSGLPFLSSADPAFVECYQDMDAAAWKERARYRNVKRHRPWVWRGQKWPTYGPTLSLLQCGNVTAEDLEAAVRRMRR